MSEEVQVIVDKDRAIVETDGMLVESFFNVKQENLAHIFSILRNQLYSDKALAVVREYTTNAFDAHVEAGIPEKPIQVKAPTLFDMSFHIRDFGLGLSEEDVFNVFASYGESTKRNSNSQVGMMGLGSKSAFCYSDSFTIVSHFNGEKKIYSAYIDDSGIGKISKINSEFTNETGLEIQIPIKRNDINVFQNTLVNFLREFNPKPVILNLSNEYEIKFNNEPEILLSGSNWQVRNYHYGQSYFVKMGNVVYPFGLTNIELEDDYITIIRNIGNCHLYIDANIGDVKPSASREMLDYIPKTKSFLRDAIYKLVEEKENIAIDSITKSSNYWEALINYGKLKHHLSKNNRELEVFGKKISSEQFKIDLPIRISRKYNDGKWITLSYINPTEKDTIYLFKGNVPRKTIYIRAQNHMALNNINSKKVYIIGFDSEQEANSYLADGLFDGINLIDVASIPYSHRKKDRVNSPLEYAELYSYKYERSICKNRDFWKGEKYENLGDELCIYVPIKYFEPIVLGKSHGNNSFQYLLTELMSINIPVPLKIYGIQTKNIKDLDDSWESFDNYVQDCLDRLTKDERMNITFSTNYRNINSFWLSLASELGEDDPTGLYELALPWQNRKRNTNIELNWIKSYGFRFDVVFHKEINNKKDEMLEQYPLLKLANYSQDPNLVSELAKYIKAVS